MAREALSFYANFHPDYKAGAEIYTIPNATIAFATFTKPAIFAPAT